METIIISGVKYIAEKGVERILEDIVEPLEGIVSEMVLDTPKEFKHTEYLKNSYKHNKMKNQSQGNGKRKLSIKEIKSPILYRRITVPGTISASAGGSIVITNYDSDEARTTGTEFAAYASVFSQFRVRAITLNLYPRYPTTGYGSTGILHDAVTLAPFYGSGPVPTTKAHLLSHPLARTMSTHKHISYTINYNDFLDGQLWSATNAAIPADSVYAIWLAGTAALVTANVVYYNTDTIWDVEFQAMAI